MCGLEVLECLANQLQETCSENEAGDLLQTCSTAPMCMRGRMVLPTISDIGHFSMVLMLGPVARQGTVR